MKGMEIKYDTVANAVYVNVSTSKVARTLKVKDQNFVVDLDESGNIVGIEMLGVSSKSELIKNLKSWVSKGEGVPIKIETGSLAVA